jgi:hypothetical protein
LLYLLTSVIVKLQNLSLHLRFILLTPLNIKHIQNWSDGVLNEVTCGTSFLGTLATLRSAYQNAPFAHLSVRMKPEMDKPILIKFDIGGRNQ